VNDESSANAYGPVPDYRDTRNEYFGKLTYTPTQSLLLNGSYRTSDRTEESASIGAREAGSAAAGFEAGLDIAIFEGSWIINNRSFATVRYTDFANESAGIPNNPLDGKPQNIAAIDKPPTFDCGGACAFGTMGDYVRFGQMLLNGGSLDGQQVLSPAFVQLMTSNHLGAGIQNRVAAVEPHRDGYGFGLGVAVRLQPGLAAVPGSPGEYSWNGANGTGFFVDPKEQLVVAFGTAAPGDIRKYYREQMQDLVYGALTRSAF